MKDLIDNFVVKVILPNFPLDDYEITSSSFGSMISYDIKYTLPFMTNKNIVEDLISETRMLLKLLGAYHFDSIASRRDNITEAIVRGTFKNV